MARDARRVDAQYGDTASLISRIAMDKRTPDFRRFRP
jgi:hypothetical protein